MTLVVDASVAFKWFVQEEGTDRAVALLERGEPFIAPDLIVAELCNAAWKSLRRRELSASQFEGIVNDVARPFVRLVPLDQLKLGKNEAYLTSAQTEDQLKKMPEYKEGAYQSQKQG